MARYIKAVECAEIISEKLNIPLCDLVDVFAEVPSADVVEVKHGKWIDEGDGDFRCSRCKDMIYVGVDVHPLCDCNMNFCPNCGADMRERIDK